MPRLRLLVGLGNPGARYQGTRHNLGFEWIDLLAERWKVGLSPWRDLGLLGRYASPEGEVLLAKPDTFMNHSGQMVGAVARQKMVQAAEVLIGFDDLALPLGQLRLRAKGSAGGHNGMRSVLEHLGQADIARLRMGIGAAPENVDPAQYVLARFTPAEKKPKAEMLGRACEAAEAALSEGLEKAMTRFNATA